MFILITNESDAVNNEKTVAELRNNIVQLNDTIVRSENEGKLVSLSSTATYSDEYLTDTDFNVQSTKTLKMVRVVKMYQWEETTSTDSNGNTVYSYSKGWSTKIISSSGFNEESGHENPTSMPYNSVDFTANNVTLGDFSIDSSKINSLGCDVDLAIANQNLNLPGGYSLWGDNITNSADLNNPSIGDIVISYEILSSDEISVLGLQSGNSIIDYNSEVNVSVFYIKTGSYTGNELINLIEDENIKNKWIERLMGIGLLMGFGACMFSPISSIFNLIPLVGSGISRFINGIGCLLGFLLALIIIGISWIAVRPTIGISLLIGSLVLIVVIILAIKGKRRKQITPVTVNTGAINTSNQINTNNNTPANPTIPEGVIPTPIDYNDNQNK